MKKICLLMLFCTFAIFSIGCKGEAKDASKVNLTANDSSLGATNMTHGFNMKTRTVKLNSDYEMPLNGIGTYSLLGQVCVDSIKTALKNGYRLIDTAHIYNNEESIGRGIRESGVPRENIFITTKLYMHQYSNAQEAIDEALRKLNVDYIDLMLLHHPGRNDVEAYKAMERAVRDGKIRSIGLSNWYIKELEAFLTKVDTIPAVVQNEIHPYYQDTAVVNFIKEKGIVVEGWYPLGGRGHQAELMQDKTLAAIAKKHGKSLAQVILRWNLQRGVVVIPGASNPVYIKENIEIYDFELTDEDMKIIAGLNRNEKHDWY